MTVKGQVVRNRFQVSPPYTTVGSGSSCSSSTVPVNYQIVNMTCVSKPASGEILIAGHVDVGAPDGGAQTTTEASVGDFFVITHRSDYKVSWNLEMSALLQKYAFSASIGISKGTATAYVYGYLFKNVTLIGGEVIGGTFVWGDVQQLHELDESVGCDTRFDPKGVCLVGPETDELDLSPYILSSPPLTLDNGTYAWFIGVQLVVTGVASGNASADLGLYLQRRLRQCWTTRRLAGLSRMGTTCLSLQWKTHSLLLFH